MKRIVMGDPHGNIQAIQSIYEKEQPDMVIILGDYCDSFVHNTDEIVSSYKKMRKMQAAHEKKHGKGTFITLLGNHDWHYIMFGERYSGFKQSTWNAMHDILASDFDAKKLPIVYVDKANKTIYSHAGLTKTWMEEWRIPEPEFANKVNENGLNFSHISFDMYGDSKWQGPLWVRPGALLSDFYEGWTQIVGHTRTRNGKPIMADVKGKNVYPDASQAALFVIDTLPFCYIRETLNEDGTLDRREIINNVEYNEKIAIQ